MKFVIGTKNVDPDVLKKIANHYVVYIGGTQLYTQMKDWTITFLPSTQSAEDPFFYGKKGVGGVTSPGLVKLYVNDVKENYINSFNPYLMANAVPITHEMAHAILIQTGRNERVPLRNDDYGGNKKGKMLPFYTAEVHDRDIEKKYFTMNTPIFDLKTRKYYSKPLRVLDIRDLA